MEVYKKTAKNHSLLVPQADQRDIAPPMQQQRSDILHQLQDTIASCEELFRQHGTGCSCDTCALVSNMLGSLKVFRMLLEIT